MKMKIHFTKNDIHYSKICYRIMRTLCFFGSQAVYLAKIEKHAKRRKKSTRGLEGIGSLSSLGGY